MPRVAATFQQIQDALVDVIRDKLGKKIVVDVVTNPVIVSVSNVPGANYKKVFGVKMESDAFDIKAKGKKLIVVTDKEIEVRADEDILSAMKKLHLKVQKDFKSSHTKASTKSSPPDRETMLDQLNDLLYASFGCESDITIDSDDDGKPIIGLTLNNEIAGDSKERLLFIENGKLAWNDSLAQNENDDVKYRYVKPPKGSLLEEIYDLMVKIGDSYGN